MRIIANVAGANGLRYLVTDGGAGNLTVGEYDASGALGAGWTLIKSAAVGSVAEGREQARVWDVAHGASLAEVQP